MDSGKYFAIKMAEYARRSCVNNAIIDDDTMCLDFETLKKIVNHFGGNLFKNVNNYSYYVKGKFDICIGNDIKSEDESITILIALGIAFFGTPDLNNKEIKINDSDSTLINSLHNTEVLSYCCWFSRAFLMPEKLYDKCMVKNTTKDGKFDCIGMSKDFNTGYMKVLTRGEDLDKWH